MVVNQFQGFCNYWYCLSHNFKKVFLFAFLQADFLHLFSSNSLALGLPWWSSGKEYTLQLQGAWVQFLVRELRSCMAHDAAKKREIN